MEIRDQNLSIFYMNRLFGLAPFELIRNPKGVLVGFRTGKAWFGYSAALITISGMFASINTYPLANDHREKDELQLLRLQTNSQFSPFSGYLFRYRIPDTVKYGIVILFNKTFYLSSHIICTSLYIPPPLVSVYPLKHRMRCASDPLATMCVVCSDICNQCHNL